MKPIEPRPVRRHLAALALLLAAAGAARAQVAIGAPNPSAPITAVRLAPGETLQLDGTLSHPAWQRAPVFNGFVEKDPVNGAVPSHETRVRVLFDDHALYVGVDALDPVPAQIRERLVRHDGVNRTQDFVVVYIDGMGRRQAAQFFRVNAAGSTADGMHTHADDSEDFAPDFDFDAASARHEGGWSTVLRLPFASLRYAGSDTGAWRIMVGRRLPREQFHLFMSAPIPLDAASFIVNMQPLQGVALPGDHGQWVLRPSLTLRSRRLDGRRESGAEASLDLKWRPRAELVVDATLNPDFSQVALDVPQLAGNTRYALELAEKRPFFFEASDLLRSPTTALYTRSFTEPRAGLRATWRGPSLAGTSFVIDDRGGGITLLPGAYGTDAVVQPASRALVARMVADTTALGGALQWGGLLAARRYAGGLGDNTVFGPDLAWQIDSNLRLRAQWLHARTSALPDAAGLQLVRGPATDADRVYLKLTRQTDEHEFDATLDDIGQGFRHDSGFVPQNGVRTVELHGGRVWRGLGPFNEFWLNLTAHHTRAHGNGQTVAQSLVPGWWASGARNLTWMVEAHLHDQLRTRPDGPLIRQRFLRQEFSISPVAWLPLLETSLDIGHLADVAGDGALPGLRATITANTRPLPRLELEPRVSVAALREHGSLAYRESATQLLAVWHHDARQSLRAILQRSLTDRRAVTLAAQREGSDTASLTWTWRRSAGTTLHLGASHERRTGSAPGRSSELFIKLQVDVDELRQAW